MKDVILPNLAEGVKKAVVSFWHVEVGEKVNKGDDLVEMMTDKAAFNVPSPVSGVLTQILAEEGAEVAVGEKIAVVR